MYSTSDRKATRTHGWPLFLLCSSLWIACMSAGAAYVGDYESTYWRAWLKIGQGKYKDAAKSAKTSLKHMAKRYKIVARQLARFEELAGSGSPRERAAAAAEIDFLHKRLEWMNTRKSGNEWVIEQFDAPDHGVLPCISEDVAFVIELAHQAVLRQYRAAMFEHVRKDYDQADAQHREALVLWESAARLVAQRLAALEQSLNGREALAREQARLDFLRERASRYASIAEGLRSEYEAMLDPQSLVNRGLFCRQRAWLYADDPDREFESAYEKRVEFFFAKALWRCQQLIESRQADAPVRRLADLLDQEEPDPPGEPEPAGFYDPVAEEWKMYTYFKEYWREDADNINID